MIIRKFVLCCLLAAATVAGAEERFKVIAHPSVPVTSASKQDLSLLFLKKITTYEKWGDAKKVVPFDLAADSSVRADFSTAVLKKSVAATKSYWQQQIFTGRGTPPTELTAEAEIIASVGRTPGAIAYVSAAATLPAGVKLVKVTD